MFNAQEMAAALEQPAFTDLDGTVYPGKLVSAKAMLPLEPAIGKFVDPGFTLPAEWDEFEQFVRALCALADLPAEQLLGLPQNLLTAALVNILGCCRGRRLPPAPTGTDAAPPAPSS